MIKVLKKYCVFLVGSLWLFPALLLADDNADSTGLHFANSNSLCNSIRLKKTSFSSRVLGLSEYKIRQSSLNFRISDFNAQNPKRTWFKAMRYSGWSRVYVLYRNMQKYYDELPTEGLTLPVNLTLGDGYQQPLMLFRLEGNPSAKTWFQTELQFDHLLGRTTYRTNSDGRYANLYVLFQLQGAVETRFGKFKMIAGGGSNWYRLSPSTMWGYQYRDDLFERYPWDPEGHDFGRYSSSYAVGDIPRDQRFGMQATQGFILEGTNLPEGFDAALLYGKTATGAFQNYLTKDPVNMFATRIGKKLGSHKVGFNYFNQFGYRDSGTVAYKPIVQDADTFYVEENRISQIITSVDGRFDFDSWSIFTELGAGSYVSNLYNVGLREDAKPGVKNVSRYQRDWDETLFLEVSTKKELTRLPLKLAFYRIGALVVNNTSSVSNTSVEQAKASSATPDEYYTNYYDGMVTDIGQLANNRQGINFFTNKNFYYNKVKTKFALGMSQEIENLAGDMRNGGRAAAVAGSGADSLTKVPFTNSISFEHKLNGLTRSRFAMYRRFTGPYNRLHSIFRRTFENIAITDSVIDYKKSFSTFDFDIKYKCNFLGKELILTNYNNYSSVQEKFSPIPLFTDKAFVRYFYEEFMTFYAVHSKLTLVGFAGFETVKGNSRVEVADSNGDLITDSKGRPVADASGKTISQIGHGYGLGLDYNFHARASLNLRHRWFDQKDKNFTRDNYVGNEMTVEFKVFF